MEVCRDRRNWLTFFPTILLFETIQIELCSKLVEDLKAMFCSIWDLAMIARPPPLFAWGKDLVAYPEEVRSAIFASLPSPFSQVSTLKKTSIWWSNIKLLFSDHLTEVPIERALNRDILIVIRKSRFRRRWQNWNINQINPICFATRFKISQLWKRDEITTWIGRIWPFFDNRLRFCFLDFRLIHKWLEAWIPRLFIIAHREFEIGEIEMFKDCKSSRLWCNLSTQGCWPNSVTR